HARCINALQLRYDPELQDGTENGIVGVAAQGRRQGHRPVGLVTGGLLQAIHQVQPVADAEVREVNDDVVALGDALLIELSERDRVHHQVAVVGNELEGHGTAGGTGNGKLPEPGHGGGQDAEAVFPRQHFHVRRIGKVDQRHVTNHAVGGEDVEE